MQFSLRLHETPNRLSLLLDLRTELGPQRLHSLIVTRLLSLSFALEYINLLGLFIDLLGLLVDLLGLLVDHCRLGLEPL